MILREAERILKAHQVEAHPHQTKCFQHLMSLYDPRLPKTVTRSMLPELGPLVHFYLMTGDMDTLRLVKSDQEIKHAITQMRSYTGPQAHKRYLSSR